MHSQQNKQINQIQGPKFVFNSQPYQVLAAGSSENLQSKVSANQVIGKQYGDLYGNGQSSQCYGIYNEFAASLPLLGQNSQEF